MEPEALKYRELFRDLISPGKKPQLVDIPVMRFLMVDGEGDPNGSESFAQAVDALYGTAYGIKFGRKKAGKLPDFSLGPLEGLWWPGDQVRPDFPGDWKWTVMLWVPEFVSQEQVCARLDELRVKKPNPALANLRLQPLLEGKCVQVLHVGPYYSEGPTISSMLRYAEERGLHPVGRHHELYFSDPRRSKPEALKTILRQPVR